MDELGQRRGRASWVRRGSGQAGAEEGADKRSSEIWVNLKLASWPEVGATEISANLKLASWPEVGGNLVNCPYFHLVGSFLKRLIFWYRGSINPNALITSSKR